MALPKRLLVTDPIEIEVFERILTNGRTRFIVDYFPGIPSEKLEDVIGRYDGLIVRSRTRVTRELLEKSHLQYVGRAGNGLDNVDLEAAQAMGIHVVNCPEGSKESVAELVLGEFITLSRNIFSSHNNLVGGKWKKHNLTGHDLAGKNFGIIGLGAIGSEVALRANAFGMNIFSYDPYKTDRYAASLGVTSVSLEELLALSNYLTVNVRLTDQTYGMLGEREITQMKDGVYLVNTSREQVINTQVLVNAVRAGKIAGYATDVFAEEPPASSHPILQLAREGHNVIVTPHIGAQTYEAQGRIAEAIARKTMDFFEESMSKRSLHRRWHLERVSLGLQVAAVVATIAMGLYAIGDKHHCDQEQGNITPWDTYIITCPHKQPSFPNVFKP
ncbi:hydroxyacid dehydrogenase [Candidatus Woesearchaeota archaeon]|nr:hydroxyacid dehydrogenase [Candidatus Woesearchaeota archaeon]